MRLGIAFVGLALAAVSISACGDSSSDSTGSPDGGSSNAGGSQGTGLFTDPSVPSCTEGQVANTTIVGTVAGQPVSLSEGGGSELDAKEYFAIGASGTANDNPMLWRPLDLKWQDALAENQAVRLTGGYVSAKPDQKYAPYYCITAGDFGPEPLSSATAVGRTFRFRVTEMVEGNLPDGGNNVDCSGAAVAGNLSGCIYRTNTYVPTAARDSGAMPPADSAGAGGSSDSGVTGPTVPSGQVQSCFGNGCPHGACGQDFAGMPCSMVYPGPVDANSMYCNAGVTGAYCLMVGPDAFNETGWVVACSNGAATLKSCPIGCGTVGNQDATCN